MMIDPGPSCSRFSTTRRNTVASRSGPRIAASAGPMSVSSSYMWRSLRSLRR